MRTQMILILLFTVLFAAAPELRADEGDDLLRLLVADDSPPHSSAVAEQLLEQVNRARRQPRSCGGQWFEAAPPLHLAGQLTAAADRHARDMASQSRLSHTGSDGGSMADRARRSGYRYRALGENVAMNSMGVEAAMLGWLDSPGHCANIMSPEFTDLGAAGVGKWWVLLFGRQ